LIEVQRITPRRRAVFGLYASSHHKHVPEMKKILNLQHAPLFVPSVGPLGRSMLVR